MEICVVVFRQQFLLFKYCYKTGHKTLMILFEFFRIYILLFPRFISSLPPTTVASSFLPHHCHLPSFPPLQSILCQHCMEKRNEFGYVNLGMREEMKCKISFLDVELGFCVMLLHHIATSSFHPLVDLYVIYILLMVDNLSHSPQLQLAYNGPLSG